MTEPLLYDFVDPHGGGCIVPAQSHRLGSGAAALRERAVTWYTGAIVGGQEDGMPVRLHGDEVFRLDVETKQQTDMWSAFVTELGYNPKQIRNKVLITRDDERGYRLHLSLKTQTAEGKDILDRAINEVVSTPIVIPLTPEQVTHLLGEASAGVGPT